MRALRRGIVVSAFAFTLVMLGGGAAWGQGRVDVEKARASYLARNYVEAEERLRTLVDPKNGLKELSLLSQARMYLGAALFAQSKRDAAAEVFEKMILDDPAFEPDPLSFPGDVINIFYDVRGQLQEKIRQAAQNSARLEAERRARVEAERRRQAAWLAKVQQMATEEKITVKNSRLVALLPFGAGQFQNRQPVLAWTLFTTQAALVVGTAVTVPMYMYALTRQDEEIAASNLRQKAEVYRDRAHTIWVVNWSFVGAFAAIAIAGIVQANVSYVPEVVEIKKRPLPPISGITPFASPMARSEGSAAPAGLVLGISGTLF